MSCSLVFKNVPTVPPPVANIVNYDDSAGTTVDGTGSVGTKVRVQIVRDGVIVETTPGETNTGTNQISVNTALQNGDQLCVQATFNDFFYYDSDCIKIPTPMFGFVPVS